MNKRYVAVAVASCALAAGCSDDAPARRAVARNHAPSVDRIEVQSTRLAPGGSTELTVVASDIDENKLIYTWLAPEGWTIAGAGAQITITAPKTYDTHATVKLRVDDEHGASDEAQVDLATRKNRPPRFARQENEPVVISPSGSTTLEANAQDPDGDPLGYRWRAPWGWQLDSDSARQVTLTAPSQQKASALVEVSVDDGHGLSASRQIHVTTTDEPVPTISSLTANPPSVLGGKPIQLTATANSPTDAELTYVWRLRDANWKLTPDGATASVVAPQEPSASTTVDLVVLGRDGARAMASVDIATDPNRAPVISSLTAQPPQANAGGLIQLAATAADPDGNTLTYHWSAPREWTLVGKGNSVQLVAPKAHDRRATVHLEVTDDFGGEVTSEIEVSTSANDAPIIASLSADPRLIDAGTTTEVAVTAADPNDDPLTYSWAVPDGWTLSGDGPRVQVGAPDKKGITGAVEVVVDDGNGQSATAQVIITTRDNRAPFVNSLTATPRVVAPGASTEVAVGASDPDGDELTYTWRTPGGWSGTSSTETIELTAPDSYSTSADVMVRVSDGSYAASEFVNVTTVDNTPPVINSVDAAPNLMPPNSEITVTAHASDPYGDALAYAWSVDDPTWSIQGNGASIQLVAPDEADAAARLTVTVSDAFGGEVEQSVVVETSSCAGHTSNCDADPSNGCEIDLDADPANCGTCAATCTGLEACVAGECVNPRAKMMVCGSSSWDTTAFIPPGSGLTQVSGCTPDASVRALLVTRAGVAATDPTSLRNFVTNGGIVITESSTSDEVFNAIFATNVAEGTLLGACRDNIAMVHQFTPDDPFWQQNAFEAAPLAVSGCGHSLAAFPGITPLSGWSEGSVALAYRDLGDGRVWLVEADWQDAEGYAMERTIRLVRSMVLW